MRKLAFALAATAAIAFTAPAFAASDAPMKLAQADVKIKVRSGEGREHRGEHRRMERHEVRMHRDHGRHEGWRHRDRHHGSKVVIIKKRVHHD